jgi:hypothetical protein
MASKVDICNRALQKLGAKSIISLTEDSRNARACNTAFEPVKLAELRAHPWNFAIKRAELAADATAPEWGRANSFTLPSDFVGMAPDYPEDNANDKDWQLEGKKILTNDSAPIYIRYKYNVTDPNEMDSLFREALACRLAAELAEALTQSNVKKSDLKADYKDVISEAKKQNAIENIGEDGPEDEWITARV